MFKYIMGTKYFIVLEDKWLIFSGGEVKLHEASDFSIKLVQTELTYRGLCSRSRLVDKMCKTGNCALNNRADYLRAFPISSKRLYQAFDVENTLSFVFN